MKQYISILLSICSFEVSLLACQQPVNKAALAFILNNKDQEVTQNISAQLSQQTSLGVAPLIKKKGSGRGKIYLCQYSTNGLICEKMCFSLTEFKTHENVHTQAKRYFCIMQASNGISCCHRSTNTSNLFTHQKKCHKKKGSYFVAENNIIISKKIIEDIDEQTQENK